ncbi:hypothetical protein HMPREF1550_02746 [Actinomyces sp. oral taxon 877 str. F0543]|nr:hypothetical protein HMPREF1550_02746 [Actinomyces sp. oral taxon 877 str. F0543]
MVQCHRRAEAVAEAARVRARAAAMWARRRWSWVRGPRWFFQSCGPIHAPLV